MKFLGVSNTNTENNLFFVSEIGFVNFSMAFAQERAEKSFAADPEPWQKAEMGSSF